MIYYNIQDENNKNIIRWNKEGNGFIIIDYKKFITELLSKNFKTEVFSSFIRQLNLYDFHKIKTKDNNNQNSSNSIYEFTNVNFLKNDPGKIHLIKRKTKNENVPNKVLKDNFPGIKGNELVVHQPRKFLNFKNDDKSKLNLNKIYKKVLKQSEIVTNLRKKVEVLEGKYDFLEYCNNEFGKNNKNIMNKLQKILEKKKRLENIFFCLIRTFFPNIKLVENALPNSFHNNSIQANNQIQDLRNSEINSQICKIFNLNDNNLSNNNNTTISGNSNNINVNNNSILSNNLENNNLLNNINLASNNINDNFNYNKTNLVQLMDKIIDKDQSNIESREINTYNEIKDFQKKYFNDLDDLNASKSKNNSIDFNNNAQFANEQENNSLQADNIKSDKDLLTVTSVNNSIENKNNQFLGKKTGREMDNTISDGSKDLL